MRCVRTEVGIGEGNKQRRLSLHVAASRDTESKGINLKGRIMRPAPRRVQVYYSPG